MKINTQIKDINSETLHRYIEARKVIDEKANRILNITHMFNLIKHCGEDTVPVSTHALIFFTDMIYSDICTIIENLDGFICIMDAESVLNVTED